MNYLTKYLQNKKTTNQKINIGYVLAGYPNINFTKEFLALLDDSSIDVLELGIPYSDPLADGKIISKASFETAESGVTTDSVFSLLENIHTQKPLVFLIYYNLIVAYGIERFVERAKKTNIRGFIIPDLPFEESFELVQILNENNIAFIPLVSPTSAERSEKIIMQGSGFVYAVGAIGITGSQQIEQERLKNFITSLKAITEKQETSLPIAIGFGVKSNADVINLKKIADGVIVGTSIVQASATATPKELIDFCNKLFMR